MKTTTIRADVAARRAAVSRGENVTGSARRQSFGAQFRASMVERDGKPFAQLEGYASTVEQSYEMWDFFGPYDEIVDAAAFAKTLSAAPDVSFLVNHGGLTMARTSNGSLELSADATGLLSRAFVNPSRTDVQDLVTAIDDGDITEMSFAFMITRGQWSPDYTEYRIQEVDLDRGDVSAVNYGANPYTSIAARAQDVLTGIDHLEGAPLRAAAARLAARIAEGAPKSAERGLALARARMALDEDRVA